MDLPGQSGEAGLGHLGTTERQCTAMPLRMAEYCLGMLRWFGKFPRQIVLYWGRSAPLRMESELRGPDVWFRYRAIDIRDLDGERLLEKEQAGDNVIAILARLRDHKEAVRRIVVGSPV